MKSNDLVRIPLDDGNIITGVIVERLETVGGCPLPSWWLVIRSDTGKVDRFHTSWMRVINESR